MEMELVGSRRHIRPPAWPLSVARHARPAEPVCPAEAVARPGTSRAAATIRSGSCPSRLVLSVMVIGRSVLSLSFRPGRRARWFALAPRWSRSGPAAVRALGLPARQWAPGIRVLARPASTSEGDAVLTGRGSRRAARACGVTLCEARSSRKPAWSGQLMLPGPGWRTKVRRFFKARR